MENKCLMSIFVIMSILPCEAFQPSGNISTEKLCDFTVPERFITFIVFPVLYMYIHCIVTLFEFYFVPFSLIHNVICSLCSTIFNYII